MVDFDSKLYDELLGKRDYTAAANYLTSLKVPSDKRAYIKQQILKLRQQARITNGFYNIANQEQKDAFNFISNIRSNNGFDRDKNGNFINPYEKQYIGLAKNLGNGVDDKGNKVNATSIAIAFDPKVVRRTGLFGWDWLAKDDMYEDNAFDVFLANNGWSRNDVAKMKGVRIEDKNGVTQLIIDKANNTDTLTKLLQAVKYVDTNHSVASRGKPIDKSVEQGSAGARYSIAGLDNNGNVINIDRNTNASTAYGNAPDIKGFTDYVRPQNEKVTAVTPSYTGTYEKSYNKVQSDVAKMQKLIDEAENKIKEASIDPVTGKPRTVATNMITTTDMGAEQTQLRNELNRGLISREDYQAGVKLLEDRYNQELVGNGLSQYQVFKKHANDDKSQSYTELTETKDRDDIDQLVKRAAMVSGAIRYNSAYSGDQYGTKLTIDLSKLDMPKNMFSKITKIINANSDTGIVELFVPKLHNDAAETAVLQDTRTRAAVEANNMELYNYDMAIPQDGTLRHNDIDGYTLVTPNGGVRSLDRASAETMLNKAFIIEDTIDEIQDGVLMPNGSPMLDNSGNPIKFNPNAENIANIRSSQAVAELYPTLMNEYNTYKAQSLDTTMYSNNIKQKQQEISNYILSAIGYFDK